MNSWFYLKEDKQRGPLSDLGLRDLFTRGELPPTALVWREGMAQWMPASSISGLVPALPPLAVALPAGRARPPASPAPAVAYMPSTPARPSRMPAWAWVLIAVAGAACALFAVLIVLLFAMRSAPVPAAKVAQAQSPAPLPPPIVQPQPPQAQPDANAGASPTALSDADIVRTEMVGGSGGEADESMNRHGIPVLGFRYSLADWGGVIVHQIAPLWAQANADLAPPAPSKRLQRGYPVGPERVVMARDGYAVGGIVTYHDQYFRGFQVTFMRFDGAKLHPEDQYSSAWCGAPARSETVQLGGAGQRVIGLFGRQGLNRDGFGLILMK
jgi:hypothetical protein